MSLVDDLRRGFSTVDRLVWLEHYQPVPALARLSEVPARMTTGITLEGVCFRYPSSGREVLSDMSLHLPAGSVVALVGDNGAGKTTLVKLLLGFYRPTTGRILIDGTDLATIPAELWHQRVTAAFQDFLRLEDAFRRSILPGDDPDDAWVEQAAARGDVLSLTHEWPEKFGTHLGTTYRAGVQLSGGQWQRVAVARAMGRARPLLLVLDEPTASLDPAAEQRLYLQYSQAAEVARASNGGITLLVSHRFATVQMADLIVVLDEGRVSECGTHADLIRMRGRYAALFARQAAAYAADETDGDLGPGPDLPLRPAR